MIQSLGAAMPVLAWEVTVAATAMILLTLAIHAFLGRRRAQVRSAHWNGCLLALILLPATCLTFPRVQVALSMTHQQAPRYSVPHRAKQRSSA